MKKVFFLFQAAIIMILASSQAFAQDYCRCEMRIDEYSSSTNNSGGFIEGSFHLNAGSKRVVAVEMSIPFFDWSFEESHCEFDCGQLSTGYPMGNFVKYDYLAGYPGTLAGCFGRRYAREVDWNITSPQTIDESIKYVISTPRTDCRMNYDYCIKVLVRYDDCTSCECTFCYSYDRVTCSCAETHSKDAGQGTGIKAAPNTGTIQIYPNPAGNKFTVSMDKTTDSKVITLVDMGGKTISRTILAGSITNYDMNNVAPGTYNVVVTADGKVTTKKVVVTK